MKNLIPIIILLGCWACQTEQEENIQLETAPKKVKTVKKIERVIDDTNLSAKLGFPKEFFQLERTRDFGTFHNDLLSIYLTKDAKVNGFKSDDVALFFLNDKLVRIRYVLQDDIMEKLIDSLQLKPNNRATLRKITINLADRTVSYKRSIDTLENRNHFYLYEELPGYKKMLWGADPNELRN